jgi:hypothetical protein
VPGIVLPEHRPPGRCREETIMVRRNVGVTPLRELVVEKFGDVPPTVTRAELRDLHAELEHRIGPPEAPHFGGQVFIVRDDGLATIAQVQSLHPCPQFAHTRT